MEIEIKLKVKNEKALKKRLAEIGAVFRDKVTNIDQYFTVKHRDFMKTKECLRIRKIPEKNISILTYKPSTTNEMKKRGFVWKEEFEIELNDDEKFATILNYLGCKKLVTVYKIREKFEFDGFVIVIDKLKDVGCFVEIEKIEDDVAAVEKGMWRILKDLKLNKEDIETANYRDLTINALKRKKEIVLGDKK